jgi:Fe-S oxidoreductase
MATAAERIEEAAATGAEALVTCCPWCESNFRNAIQQGGKSIKLYGLLDLVNRAI